MHLPILIVLAVLTALCVTAFARDPEPGDIVGEKAPGYRGIWYWCQETGDEYVYKYSGGLGTYCAKHVPLAVYSKEAGRTFFTYGGVSEKGSLLEMVSFYDHESGTVPRPTVLMDKETSDAHDNVTVMLDDEGYVWCFASAHGTARPAYVFRSIRPHSTEKFEVAAKFNFSYPQAWYMGERGWLFLHTHYEEWQGQHGRTLWWMTSPDGRNWGERNRLARVGEGHYQVSRRCGGKVGTSFNYHPPRGEDGQPGLNWRTNLHYLETADMGRTWCTVDGRTVDPPLREVDNPALVRDYRQEGRNVYMKDVNFDAAGRPVILYVTSGGWHPGPRSAPFTWTVARWSGDAWKFSEVTESDSNYDTGCLHVEAGGTWRIIGPTETGPQPYNPGGEMALWISTDAGATWEKRRQITAGSEYNHTYARRPVEAHPGFYALWADGHGRQPSESRIYFCDREGNAYRLPQSMDEDSAEPKPLNP